jgi:hypothetical protein
MPYEGVKEVPLEIMIPIPHGLGCQEAAQRLVKLDVQHTNHLLICNMKYDGHMS